MTTLINIAENIAKRITGDLQCESCGQPFSCGLSLKGCWCSEVSLTAETRVELRERFKDCLCRDCLEKFCTNELNRKRGLNGQEEE
jgi:hypothetical protein